MSQNVLNIPVSEKTRRKLGALAILSGKKFDSIETEISEMIDQILTDKIDAALANIDGRELSLRNGLELATPAAPAVQAQRTLKSFADAEQASQASDLAEDLAGHSLSAEDDLGQDSLEDQYKAEEERMRQAPAQAAPRQPLPQQPQEDDLRPPEIKVPDVGEDTEAFLDSTLAPPAQTGRVNRYASPTKSYDPKTRKARVSDYTGEESGDLF